MTLPNMDRVARAIVQKVAEQFEVGEDGIFRAWPRTALEDAARSAAIAKLANETVPMEGRTPRYRYPIVTLMAWFGVSRPTISRSRSKAKDYRPRRKVSVEGRARAS